MRRWMNKKDKERYDPESEENSSTEEFRDVSITITVLGLTHGILMESKKHDGNNCNLSKNGDYLDQLPVVAVVSGLKEASNAQCHLPSLPLTKTKISYNLKPRKYEFIALWPNIAGQEQSNLTFTRRIKRKMRRKDNHSSYPYSNERLILAVSLMKGFEIITLGQVSIPFSFSDNKVQTQLPIRTTLSHVQEAAAEIKGVKYKDPMFLSRNRFVKPLSFTDDPERVFSFHQDSMLSATIQTQVNDSEIQKFNLDDIKSFQSGGLSASSQVSSISGQTPMMEEEKMESNNMTYSHTVSSSEDDSLSQCLVEDAFVSFENKENKVGPFELEQTNIDEVIDDDYPFTALNETFLGNNRVLYQTTDNDMNQIFRGDMQDTSCQLNSLKFIEIYNNGSFPSTLSSPTVTGCIGPTVHDSPRTFNRKKELDAESYFPTVDVSLESTSSDYEEVDFPVMINNL